MSTAVRLTKKPRSIAFRLIAAVLAVELVSAALVIFLSLGYERHTHFRSFDVMLHGRADSVLGAVQDAEDTGDNVMLDQADLHVPPEDVYEVWDGRGHLLGRSPNWQGQRRHDRCRHATASSASRSTIAITASSACAARASLTPASRRRQAALVTILYGAPTERVWHAIHGAVEFYAAGMLLLVLITGPLIAWLLHRGLEPLRQLATLAADVSVDSWEFTPPARARHTAELAPAHPRH